MIFCTQYHAEGWYDRINSDPNNGIIAIPPTLSLPLILLSEDIVSMPVALISPLIVHPTSVNPPEQVRFPFKVTLFSVVLLFFSERVSVPSMVQFEISA